MSDTLAGNKVFTDALNSIWGRNRMDIKFFYLNLNVNKAEAINVLYYNTLTILNIAVPGLVNRQMHGNGMNNIVAAALNMARFLPTILPDSGNRPLIYTETELPLGAQVRTPLLPDMVDDDKINIVNSALMAIIGESIDDEDHEINTGGPINNLRRRNFYYVETNVNNVYMMVPARYINVVEDSEGRRRIRNGYTRRFVLQDVCTLLTMIFIEIYDVQQDNEGFYIIDFDIPEQRGNELYNIIYERLNVVLDGAIEYNRSQRREVKSARAVDQVRANTGALNPPPTIDQNEEYKDEEPEDDYINVRVSDPSDALDQAAEGVDLDQIYENSLFIREEVDVAVPQIVINENDPPLVNLAIDGSGDIGGYFDIPFVLPPIRQPPNPEEPLNRVIDDPNDENVEALQRQINNHRGQFRRLIYIDTIYNFLLTSANTLMSIPRGVRNVSRADLLYYIINNPRISSSVAAIAVIDVLGGFRDLVKYSFSDLSDDVPHTLFAAYIFSILQNLLYITGYIVSETLYYSYQNLKIVHDPSISSEYNLKSSSITSSERYTGLPYTISSQTIYDVFTSNFYGLLPQFEEPEKSPDEFDPVLFNQIGVQISAILGISPNKYENYQPTYDLKFMDAVGQTITDVIGESPDIYAYTKKDANRVVAQLLSQNKDLLENFVFQVYKPGGGPPSDDDNDDSDPIGGDIGSTPKPEKPVRFIDSNEGKYFILKSLVYWITKSIIGVVNNPIKTIIFATAIACSILYALGAPDNGIYTILFKWCKSSQLILETAIEQGGELGANLIKTARNLSDIIQNVSNALTDFDPRLFIGLGVVALLLVAYNTKSINFSLI